MYNIPDFWCLILHQADRIDFLSKTESCLWQFILQKFYEIRTDSFVVFALIFFTYLPESQIKEKKNIYSNKFFHNFRLSESSFTCPRRRTSGFARRLLLYMYKLTLIPIFCISRIKGLVIFGKICTTFELLPIFRHFGLF